MVKKVLKSSVFAVIFTVFAIVSCTDVLDQVNPNSISSDTFWRDGNDALKAITAVYHGAGTTYDNYGGVRQFIMWRSDEINDPSGLATSTFRHSSATWAQQRIWNINYGAIANANDVIENVPGIIDMDAIDRDNITGEAYFLRAWAHFDLVMMFENIVLQTENATTSDELFPFQSPSSEVYAQVIADLIQAEGLLQPKGYYPTEMLGRADRGAATALKGKAYLYTQQWSQAASTFQGLSGQYSLVANYRDNFREDTEFNAESIYELPAQDAVKAAAGGWLSGYTGGNGNTAAFVSGGQYGFSGMPGYSAGSARGEINPWVRDLYLETPDLDGNVDLRGLANIGWNHPDNILFNGETFEFKYGDPALGNEGYGYPNWIDKVVNKKWSDIETRDGWTGYGTAASNWRAIRYADVLLMYAEAQNEAVGPDASVYAAINQVRARANMPDITPGLSKDGMTDAIRKERTLELYMEGTRFQDLRRWGTMTEAFLTDHPGSKSLAGVEFQPGRDELMPIPQHELDANPNIVQNPGFIGG